MPSYKFTQDALTDLLKIRKFTLETWGKEQSKKYLQELNETLQLLSDSPAIGKNRSDISTRTFSFSYASHVIYYKIEKKVLVVFAVLHKNMVPEKHLNHRQDS